MEETDVFVLGRGLFKTHPGIAVLSGNQTRPGTQPRAIRENPASTSLLPNIYCGSSEACGYGSKMRTQNGTLLNGTKD